METAMGGGTKAGKMKTAAEKQPSSMACIKFWVVVISIMLLILWVCAMQLATLDGKIMVPKSAFFSPYSFPPQRVYKSNGYLIISTNGGLNQKRLGVLPRIQKRGVLLFAQTDARLANNGLPEELQRLRCRVNYKALGFTRLIEETGRKIVDVLREKGPFLALHLRYEKDVLAFTGCKKGLTKEEAAEVKQMRYSHDGWTHKPIDWKKKQERGSCPLTPEDTALVLQALGIDNTTTIYIAAGEIYNKERRLADLAAAYPNLASKQTILRPEELEPFMEHADQMAALDYIVAIESDVFVPTFVGNMDKAVEGHRRYLGFKTTISLDRKLLFGLIDQYKNGTLLWDEFSLLVKKIHEDRRGKPAKRRENPDHPRQEDNFYSNPYECLPPFASTFN
ncbi:hypothetical protein V6N13_105444 [Hibiscus sabdariffa]|uniref:O-fucosyltransferase family protein n=1 Tax=Hibiscus sabdariffa TaxID=183260 RepID=A0ABR2EXD4_9ROSI